MYTLPQLGLVDIRVHKEGNLNKVIKLQKGSMDEELTLNNKMTGIFLLGIKYIGIIF